MANGIASIAIGLGETNTTCRSRILRGFHIFFFFFSSLSSEDAPFLWLQGCLDPSLMFRGGPKAP